MIMLERKLLPYEHGLVDALGITQEEYFEFLDVQQEYNDPKAGTILDARNTGAEIALVLTIVGILFQAASILLAPKPDDFKGDKQTRDQRFAPRFGFNGAQELAKYGDTVPLIYTSANDNRNGGVRVSTSLLWSAVLSFGSSQFMRLMMCIGAATVKEIIPERTAIGQLPFRDVVASRAWLYFSSNGATSYGDYVEGKSSVLARSGGAALLEQAKEDPTYRVSLGRRTATLGGNFRGFSQTYSPSTGTAFGVTGVVPVQAAIVEVLPNGKLDDPQVVPVEVIGLERQWTATNNRPVVRRGTEIEITITGTNEIKGDEKDENGSVESRRQAVRAAASVFDEGSLYKLGGAIFRVKSIRYQRDGDIDRGSLTAKLLCEEPGAMPAAPYEQITSLHSLVNTLDLAIEQREKIEDEIKALEDQLSYIQAVRKESPAETKELRAVEKQIKDLETKETQLKDRRAFLRQQVKTAKNASQKANREARLQETINNLNQTQNELGKLERKRDRLISKIDLPSWTQPSEIRKAIDVLKKDLQKAEKEENKTRRAPKEAANVALLARMGTKCLAKIEEGSYASVTKCSSVEFALRSKVFRRVSGRSRNYGKKGKNYGYKAAENGTQPRTAMFMVEYSRDRKNFIRAPYVFCIRNAAEQDVFSFLRFQLREPAGKGSFNSFHWDFRFIPVVEPAAERGPSFERYCYIRPGGSLQSVQLSDGTVVEFRGGIYNFSQYPRFDNGPLDTTEWELFNYDSRSNTQFSFEQGPEISITAVNEQWFDEWSVYGPNLYRGLSTLALHAYSGRGFQDLRNVTAWVSEGKEVRRLSTEERDYDTDAQISAFVNSRPNGSSSYAPDIFVDTVLDNDNGIGQYAKQESLDFVALARTKAFCVKNKLFMDALIADARSWREFWTSVAAFSLLEFGKIGGKETLLPAIPANKNGNILSASPLPIQALFNQGNIIENSFKEEYIDYGASVQDVIVTAVYRDTEKDGFFPRNNSVECRLRGVDDRTAIRETVDLSQYVTTKQQATLVARFSCLSRNLVRKAFEWQTFPTDSFISPGSYVYLDAGMNAWDNIYTGVVMKDGELNSPLAGVLNNGTYNFLLYKGGRGIIRKDNVRVVNGFAAEIANLESYLFVVGRRPGSTRKRVVKITEVSTDEEGLVTIKGVGHPVDASGVSLLAKTIVDARAFTEQ
jgi:predicted  nucleic acid-binding Zn-ribbon protein